MAAHLLLDENYQLFCLVRSVKGDPQESLIRAVLKWAQSANIPPDAITAKKIERIRIIVGDITRPLLGIAEKELQLLMDSHISQIWHCAGSSKIQPIYREEAFEHNVDGTRNVIDLAKLLRISEFNHMSTAYVAGTKSSFIPETYYDASFPARNVYEESKRLSEDLVISASKEVPFHLRIFRPSLILDKSRISNPFATLGFDGFLCTLDRFIEWIRDRLPEYLNQSHLTIYAEQEAALDLVPIETLINAAISISNEKKTNSPEFHHLSSPFSIPINTLLAAMHDSNLFAGVTFDFTSNNNELKSVDDKLRQKLDFYAPYLLSDKQFEQQRNTYHLFPELHSIRNELCNTANTYLSESRETTRYSEEKVRHLWDTTERKTINSRLGTELHYFTIGKGPVIVIVNAYGIPIKAWDRVIVPLSEDHKVIIWECRGLSNSDHPSKESNHVFSGDDHSKDMKEILDSEKVDCAHIVAWCSGTKPALRFFQNNPLLVNSLTFITGNFAPLKGHENISTKWEDGVRSVATTLQSNPEMNEVFLKIVSDMLMVRSDSVASSEARVDDLIGAVSPKYRNMLVNPFLNEERSLNWARMIDEFYHDDISGIITKINVPTFFLSVRDDEVVSTELSEIVSRSINRAKKVVLPAASHWCIMESGSEIAYHLRSFINNLGA